MSNFREHYKVDKNSIKESFISQMGLKMNMEYEEWADRVGTGLIEYFLSKYKGITIEIPKAREKSPKSLLGKIKNLQIERLSKLYAIEGIDDKEKEILYSLIKERIYENEDLNIIYTLAQIKELIYGDIEKFDIKEFEHRIMIEGISNSTKTALLRILISKLENSNISDKEEKISQLDEKYGKNAAIKSGILENDIIRYSSIITIRNCEEKRNRLKDEMGFLKANDLKGMKIVVERVPDDLETENIKIKEILKRRKQTHNKEEEKAYAELLIIEIGKEFYKDLENNEELQERLNIKIIPNSSKHKKKSNGYEAEHIKFYSATNPQYTLELQYKSGYVENICRGEGIASHQNRPGKRRVLPHASNDAELMKKLEYEIPKYKVFRIQKNGIEIKKFDMLRNVIGYYENQILSESEEYEKILELFNYDSEKEEMAK